MLLMALLPASHVGNYPAPLDIWAKVLVAFTNRIGEKVNDGRYEIASIDDKGMVLRRVETGSKVKITRTKTEAIYCLLVAGRVIEHRKIDYTVAVEFGVVLLLGDLVEDDGKTYRLARRAS